MELCKQEENAGDFWNTYSYTAGMAYGKIPGSFKIAVKMEFHIVMEPEDITITIHQNIENYLQGS